jgi:hypothetical protein
VEEQGQQEVQVMVEQELIYLMHFLDQQHQVLEHQDQPQLQDILQVVVEMEYLEILEVLEVVEHMQQ